MTTRTRIGIPLAIFILLALYAFLFLFGKGTAVEGEPVAAEPAIAPVVEPLASTTAPEPPAIRPAAATVSYKTVEECHDETTYEPGDGDPDEDDGEGDDEDDMRPVTKRVCVTRQVPVATTASAPAAKPVTSAPSTGATPKPAPAQEPAPSQGGYTLAQVSAHATRGDCWMAISGKVYDLTPFFSAGHPGGAKNLELGCGKDATSLYTSEAGAGHAHSGKAKSMLSPYYLGILK